jgi:Glycosyl transferase family 2
MTKRILIASPVRQVPGILAEFLRSLSELDSSQLEIEFFFIDDNDALDSSALLEHFRSAHPHTTVQRVESGGGYICDAETHRWSDELIWKVAQFKDRMISEALNRGSDFLFLLDSDVVIPPQLLGHLVSQDKPIVSEVFWTSWQPDGPMFPQVWATDQYTLFQKARGETLTKEQALTRMQDFLRQLRKPGLYKVGGLGACTLMARHALAKGVSFAEVDNLSLSGEDRHFCVRARALGIDLWADSRYPPLHVYRESDLARVAAYRTRFAADYLANPKLTLSMVVRDEADKWLRNALQAHRPFIDEAVIIDDASTDNTVDVIREELHSVPLRLVRNSASRFSNEIELRKQQWEEALATNPDWLLNLDADQILEERAAHIIPQLTRQTDYSVFGFELYDFWTPTHYRDDEWWRAHKAPQPFLIRYTPDFRYVWRETPQHCGRIPANMLELNAAAVDLRVKHMGWANSKERERKLKRYQALDPEARFGIKAQYESILDPAPNLVEWQE